MVNYLMTLGWSPPGDDEIVPWSTIEREFRLEDVNHSPAFFDVKKLTAFNGEYIRKLSIDEFIAACEPFLLPTTCRGRPSDSMQPSSPRCSGRAVASDTLAEVPGVIDFVFLADPVLDEQAWDKTMATPGAKEVLAETTDAYRQLAEWDAASS